MNKERSLIYISGKISAPTELGVQENLNRMLEAGVGYRIDHPESDVYLPGESNKRLGEALNFDWSDYMKADLNVLKRCDTIYMVDNWEESRGARIEHFLANKWGKNIEYEMQEGLDYTLLLQ